MRKGHRAKGEGRRGAEMEPNGLAELGDNGRNKPRTGMKVPVKAKQTRRTTLPRTHRMIKRRGPET